MEKATDVRSADFCPYRGLEPYTSEFAEYFFGRERDQRMIVSNLHAAPLTILYGASGVGKSSILLAGVVPQLQHTSRLALFVFRTWQASDFGLALKRELLNAVTASARREIAVDHTLPLDQLLLQCAMELRGRVFVIFDQFEEYFFYHSATSVNSFDAELACSINSEEVGAHFLISLREDSLSKLDRFQGRIPNLLSNMLRLDGLERRDAERAIREPLKAYNSRLPSDEFTVEIETELVEALLEDPDLVGADDVQNPTQARGARIETAFLQLVLTRLWAEEKSACSHSLRVVTLRRLGGAKHIVGSHLTQVMQRLSEHERAVAAVLFRYLVTASGTKVAYTLTNLAAVADLPTGLVQPVLNRLTSQDLRILRTVAGYEDQPEDYEIFHDVLAPAILSWRAAYVQSKERAEAEQKAALDAAEREREAARARELEAAKALALAEAKRAEAETQRAVEAEHRASYERAVTRQLRRRAFVALGAAMLTLIFASLAFYQEHRAEQQRSNAEAQARTATALRLASQSSQLLDKDLPLSLLLAVEAVRNKESVQAIGALMEAVGRLGGLTIAQINSSLAVLAVSSDGRLLLTVSEFGSAALWNVTASPEGVSARFVVIDQQRSVNSAQFSPDGRSLAIAFADGPTMLVEVPTGLLRMSLGGHNAAVYTAQFSPDGRRLVTASADKTARLWDAITATPIGKPMRHDGAVYSAQFSPDGRWLVTGSEDKTARLWDGFTAEAIGEPMKQNGPVNFAQFSPDGRSIMTTSNDGNVRLWDLADQGRTARLRLVLHGSAPIRLAVIRSDNRWIITASSDGTARLWDLRGPVAEPVVLRGHAGPIEVVTFSLDNRWLVTGGKDGTARCWNLMAQDPAASPVALRAHLGGVSAAAISPNTRWLVTGGADGKVRLWFLQADDLISQARFATRRNLTMTEWNLYFPDEPYHKTFPDLPGP